MMIFALGVCLFGFFVFKLPGILPATVESPKETLSIEPTEANISALRDLWAASERKPFDLSRHGVDFDTLKQLHAEGYARLIKTGRVANGLVLTAKGHVDASILMRNQWVAP